MQGPQYIVGRSYPPANGTPERRKVGKFHSKGLKTSFQQSLRRSKHGGKRDPPASTGWAGRAARLPTRARHPAIRAGKDRQCRLCPYLPSDRSGLLVTGQPCRWRGQGTGLWFKGSHMPKSCSRPALGARILGTFMPPPVSQVRAPQTGQVGMNSQTCQRGTSSRLHAWSGSLLSA